MTQFVGAGEKNCTGYFVEHRAIVQDMKRTKKQVEYFQEQREKKQKEHDDKIPLFWETVKQEARSEIRFMDKEIEVLTQYQKELCQKIVQNSQKFMDCIADGGNFNPKGIELTFDSRKN